MIVMMIVMMAKYALKIFEVINIKQKKLIKNTDLYTYTYKNIYINIYIYISAVTLTVTGVGIVHHTAAEPNTCTCTHVYMSYAQASMKHNCI